MANFPQLTEEDFNQFNSILGDLLANSEASIALIVEKAGHLIHECGEQGRFETTLVATLASNAYNATAFMANLITETQFSGMYQQGENYSSLILNIEEHCVLVIIFKASLSVGAIKYYASQAIPKIADQLGLAEKRAPSVCFDLTDLNVSDAAGLFRMKEAEAVPAPEPVRAETPAVPEPELVLVADAAPVDPFANHQAAPPAAPPPEVATAQEFLQVPAPEPEQKILGKYGEPMVARQGPYISAVEPGFYYWCACGRSQNQPFCDGAHQGTGLEPVKVEINQYQKRAFCGCKFSKHPPFCDGTHSRI